MYVSVCVCVWALHTCSRLGSLGSKTWVHLLTVLRRLWQLQDSAEERRMVHVQHLAAPTGAKRQASPSPSAPTDGHTFSEHAECMALLVRTLLQGSSCLLISHHVRYHQ